MKRATGPAASSRATPLRSSTAVRTIFTRESGSSIQSTGSSWMRRPRRWASTSSSVSKNQPSSRPASSSPGRRRRRPAPRVGAPARLRAGPRGSEGAAAALAIEPQEVDAGQRRGEAGGDLRRVVGARVICDYGSPREREALGEEAVQASDGVLERGLLVEGRHDDRDVEGGEPEGKRGAR